MLLTLTPFSPQHWGVRKILVFFCYCSTFVFIWQILFNHGVIRLKRFISQISDKLCNYFLFLSLFNASCMRPKIRCDVTENLKKFYELNKVWIFRLTLTECPSIPEFVPFQSTFEKQAKRVLKFNRYRSIFVLFVN